jgi:hypothetical protein
MGMGMTDISAKLAARKIVTYGLKIRWRLYNSTVAHGHYSAAYPMPNIKDNENEDRFHGNER